MPFTVSHAAAVLPFRKLNLVWSAFIIGSMAPDFPYITGTTDYRALGHDYPGLLYFTLPAALVALWLFHNIIKQPMVGLLPPGVQARLGGIGAFPFGGPSRFAAILASVILGIATHIVWDSFTHAFTWPWMHFAWLRGLMSFPVIGIVPRFSALQYASSLVGLAALVIWVILWCRQTTPAVELPPARLPTSRFRLAVAMFVIAGIVGFLRASVDCGMPPRLEHVDAFMLVFGVTSLALAFWQLLLYCVLVSTHQVWTLT